MMKSAAPVRFTREAIAKMSAKERSMLARSVTCGETMIEAHTVFAMDSVAEVLEQITQTNWDDVFIINED